ncbi:MAG: S1/P1 nuclease [Nitrospina sp.]|jgi:hypothetical protein|nr:S1/P1 nuclease [Nitrospina sp.]MBT6717634.1 S1/P1 nuclease [Nitrospina sp.]
MFRGKKINLFVCRFWLVAILFSINIDDAHGWGPQGHRVIGYIADFNLTPDTKKNIVEEFNINNLADVAIWADKIRRKRKQEKPWHYTNIKEDEWTYVMQRDCPNGNCVIEKIKDFSRVLGNNEIPFQKRKEALKYLVHFVGDVHQPLHLGNQKDRGGGKIRLSYLGKNVSLHYLWDGGLIDWKNESFSKYAARLNNRLVDSEKSEWLNSPINDWADESRSLALKYAYPLEDMELSKKYLVRGREILDQRMVQAGVRLANLLNKLFQP